MTGLAQSKTTEPLLHPIYRSPSWVSCCHFTTLLHCAKGSSFVVFARFCSPCLNPSGAFVRSSWTIIVQDSTESTRVKPWPSSSACPRALLILMSDNHSTFSLKKVLFSPATTTAPAAIKGYPARVGYTHLPEWRYLTYFNHVERPSEISWY